MYHTICNRSIILSSTFRKNQMDLFNIFIFTQPCFVNKVNYPFYINDGLKGFLFSDLGPETAEAKIGKKSTWPPLATIFL